MKMSAGVEWAVHCCVVLSRAAGPVPAARLAEFHGVSKTYLARHLQGLDRPRIVVVGRGFAGFNLRPRVRVMAERIADTVCSKLGVVQPCTTATTEIAPAPARGARGDSPNEGGGILGAHVVSQVCQPQGEAQSIRAPRREERCHKHDY
jgi:hypothetical protein